MTRDEAIEKYGKSKMDIDWHPVDALIELGLLKVDEPKKSPVDMLAVKLICSTEYLQRYLDELGFKVTLK